jgi:hypothetical protein
MTFIQQSMHPWSPGKILPEDYVWGQAEVQIVIQDKKDESLEKEKERWGGIGKN